MLYVVNTISSLNAVYQCILQGTSPRSSCLIPDTNSSQPDMSRPSGSVHTSGPALDRHRLSGLLLARRTCEKCAWSVLIPSITGTTSSFN
jgi:hypothetical protein